MQVRKMNDWYELRKMIAERFVVDETEVDLNTNLRKEFNASSLDLLELILAMKVYLKAPYAEEVTPEDIGTPQDLMNLLKEKEYDGLDERHYGADE